MTKLLGWDLVLCWKTPKEDEKFDGVVLSFSELFVSDCVAGKSDGMKEEKRGNVSFEAELPDRELATGNNEYCTGGAEHGIRSSLSGLPGFDLADGNKEDMQIDEFGILSSLTKLPG